MAYPNRTPEEQAAIEQRKYRAWNDLTAGARRRATPAAEALAGGLANPAVNLATAVGPNLPRFDFRSPGAAYPPERTAQIVQDFRSSLPGPAAGQPTFQDRRPRAPATPARPAALDALFQQSPVAGPRELTAEGLVSRRPAAMGQLENTTPRRSPQAIAREGRETLTRFGAEPRSAAAIGQEGRETLAGRQQSQGPGLDQATRAAAVLGPAVDGGQGWAQFENGPRYEIDQGRVRKLDAAGREQPMRGAVNVLSPEETRNLFGPRGGATAPQQAAAATGGPPDYDPDRLAEAQFRRIKDAADALMQEAHSTVWDDVRAAKYKAAQALYAQLGGASNAGVAAGGGIAQEGVRGRSFLAQQQLQNQGALQEQQARNTGAYDVQRLQGEQAVDIEELKNEGLLSRERLVSARETAKQRAEREDKMAERMGMTTYDAETGLPLGQVPTPKYDYGSKPARQAFQPGQTYRHRDGSVYRYNGGDIDDPKSWSKL